MITEAEKWANTIKILCLKCFQHQETKQNCFLSSTHIGKNHVNHNAHFPEFQYIATLL